MRNVDEKRVIESLDVADRKCYESYLKSLGDMTYLERKEVEFEDYLERKLGGTIYAQIKVMSNTKFPTVLLTLTGDVQKKILGTNMYDLEKKVISFAKKI